MKKIEENLWEAKVFLGMTQKEAWFIKKERIELSNFMKIIYSCSVKNTIKGMKRQVTEWEKKLQVIYSTME